MGTKEKVEGILELYASKEWSIETAFKELSLVFYDFFNEDVKSMNENNCEYLDNGGCMSFQRTGYQCAFAKGESCGLKEVDKNE